MCKPNKETFAAIMAAHHGVERTRAALGTAQELHALAVERYNAILSGLGLNPATVRVTADGILDDNGVPPRDG